MPHELDDRREKNLANCMAGYSPEEMGDDVEVQIWLGEQPGPHLDDTDVAIVLMDLAFEEFGNPVG